MPEAKRQLAAIMFTDIVGYTALMGKDSEKALELVRVSKEIQKPLVEKHNGKWLKEMGDGAMAQFNTALDAVKCSIEIQEIARGKLDGKLRIGIHSGDITIEEDDVYGDGVNVASRLESIADPGGIYISDNIEKAIRGQTDIQAKYLGEVKLKNVDYGVRTYALQGVGLPTPEVKEEKQLSGHFGAELQRRGVLRAGVAYVVITLLLILLLREAASWITLPDWAFPVLISTLVVAFPLAMYLAWNYERSPEGFVRTTSRESWQNPYSTSQRKPLTGNLIIAGLILVIIVMYTYPRYLSSEVGNPTGVYNPILGEKSIAVLPFENLSNDPEQEYFADGIHEDILNQLAKIADLQVKSRTSTLRYKGNTEKSMGDIGRELEVAHILEGSVRKAGNRVRINAQLIDVETNNHIWSEVYDRELTDIFAIQSEVAMEIAKVMKAQLSPAEAENIGRAATENITAYDYYLKARQLPPSDSRFDNRVQLLQQAIELDPQFAKAYAELARALYDGGFGLPSEIWLDSALVLANKAIELNPDEPEGYAIRARISEISLRELEDARKDLETALELDPNNPNVISTLAWNLIHTGEPEQGAALLIKAIDLEWGVKDPQYYRDWGRIYFHIEEFDKAEALFLQAEKLDPGWDSPKYQLGVINESRGDYDKAIQYYESIDYNDGLGYSYLASGDLDMAESSWERFYQVESEMEDTSEFIPFRHRLGYVNWLRGDSVEARRLLEEQIRLDEDLLERSDVSFWSKSAGSTYYDLAASKAFLGFREEALDVVEHPDLFWGNVFMLSKFLDTDPLFEPIRDEPRFRAVADKWRNVSRAVKDELRRLVREREASEQLKFALDK